MTCTRTSRPVLPVLGLLLGLFAIAPQTLAQEAAPKVSVAAVYSRDVTESITFIGRGEAIDTVDIVARVSGFIEKVAVSDGAKVEEGEMLFHIEADTYEADLASRQADLSRAEANLDLARIELERKQTLLDRGSGTESDRDIALANEKGALADVKTAQAAIRQAELDLGYTNVKAPFSGRIGRIAVSRGELVTPTSGPLVTLVRVDPIYVAFSIAERQFVTLLQRLQTTGAELAKDDNNPDVTVILPNGTEFPSPGEIVFVDNKVSATTGTIALRARFDNKDELLSDGAFVTIRIAAQQPVSKLVIPQAALQRDQRGDFALVVNQTGIVSQRYVTLGQQIDTEIVVEDGLMEGESVIVEGLQQVRPGVEVEPVLAAQPVE